MADELGAEYTPVEARANRIFDRLNQRIGAIIMGQAENTAKQVTEQLGKAKGELDTLIAGLQDTSVDPGTLQQLQAASQALDDIVPDQVVDSGSPDTGTDAGADETNPDQDAAVDNP